MTSATVTRQDLLARSAELRAARVPFVHAQVVLAERPTSAKPGDAAIVLGDGTVEGFVGGSCAEATVREESLALLGSGQTIVLRITPQAEEDQPGKHVVHNPCLSGGTLELFLEDEAPAPLVTVVGEAPIAAAVARIGTALGWDVRPFDGAVAPDTTAVVVASHGRGEEPALRAALEAGVGYIGLVASPKRGRAVLDALDLDAGERARIKTPAGLDIGCRTPEESALSILAEIVSFRPRRVVVAAPPTPRAGTSVDPVCGMTVAETADALRAEHAGRTAWFCGRGCMEAFLADPAAYGG